MGMLASGQSRGRFGDSKFNNVSSTLYRCWIMTSFLRIMGVGRRNLLIILIVIDVLAREKKLYMPLGTALVQERFGILFSLGSLGVISTHGI